MVSKRFIADQAMLRISKGYADSSSAVQTPDLIAAIGQILPFLIKQQYAQTLQAGDTIPDGLFLTTYDNLSVKSLGKKSSVALPAIPISLPMGLGVYEVTDGKCFYIPLQPGQSFLLQGQDCICNLLGNVGYEIEGQNLVFSKNITIDNTNSISVKMLLPDLNSYGDYDPLPIPKDMEYTIVEMLVKQFAPSQTNSDTVDNLNTEKQEVKQ